jgi:hypothetical protein
MIEHEESDGRVAVWRKAQNRAPVYETLDVMPDSFPPPWSVEELDGCIIVWDRTDKH